MSNNLPSYLSISTSATQDLAQKIDHLQPDKYAFLVDEHTREFCLPLLNLDKSLTIEISSGELNKTLSTCEYIWQKMTDFGFSRKSLLINLGGGVIGDMGGFCASTYKRGIPFINIPTTLLSQVDASIGGKLGVDFNGLKNHIGLFQEPNAVIVDTVFLKTLSAREFKSGFAEIIKHSLIQSSDQWDYLINTPFEEINWETLIPRSIQVKNEIVTADPKENGLRKTLNYGHTIGHAIETYFLSTEKPLTHGEAIAIGMLIENKLAVQSGILSSNEEADIENYLSEIYQDRRKIPSYEILMKYLMQDKKNDNMGIRFSLLERIGHCAYDVLVSDDILKEVLK
ncbi:MAG: 3-dehydroquinate synthase [Ekhidna sp.]|nr:3-dehydroquinate synthase [Ekhidna sp.]